MGRRHTLAVALLFPAVLLSGAPLGYFLLQGQPETVQLGLLSFTAGLLVLVVVEGLVPEAHSLTRKEAGKAATVFLAGFTLFALLSLYFG